MSEANRSGQCPSGTGRITHPLVPRTASEDPPTSFSQERLWVLEQAGVDAAHSLRMADRLVGALDVVALRRAFETVVERHEVLRTTFPAVDGGPVQRIAPTIELPFEITDLGDRGPAERESEVRRLIAEEVGRPFDLVRGPLFLIRLYRLADHDHVLLVTVHNLVFDGWSVSVFKREWSSAYRAIVTGTAPRLDALRVQYADFAVWQRTWLQGATLDGMPDHRRGRSRDLPAVQLPADHARPAVPSFKAAELRFEVPPDLSAALHDFSREHGASPATTLLATFEVLLSRYTAQDEVVVGVPVANRATAEARGLIGLFAGTLVVRADLSGDPPFTEILDRVKQASQHADGDQEVPSEQLVDEFAPKHDPSRAPLLPVTFAFQSEPEDDLALAGLSVVEFECGVVTTRFDLELELHSRDSALRGRVIYSRDLFEHATVERLQRHYLNLLRAIVQHPETRLTQLRMIDEAERQQMIALGRGQRTNYPQRPVHELFEEQAEVSPDAVALVDGDQVLTYRECNRQANRIAYHLQRLGVGPEAPVGILLGRSAQAVVAMLGVLKAGGAYVPLDPAYPRKRLALMLSDTRARVVLTCGALAGQLPETSAEVVELDRVGSSLREYPDHNPSSGASPESLAYIMYTSGSTGSPKGCCVVHRGIVRLVRNTDYVQLGRDEVILQYAPLSFDASTFEIWGSLLNGGKLIVMQPAMPSLSELGRAIVEHGITTLWLTAVLFRHMVDDQPEQLRSVRQLLAGGEALSAPHVNRWLESLGEGQVLINGYGPTENTTFTCCHRMTAGYRFAGSVPIGRPIANTDVYILDRNMEPVPVGVAGRLYTGGAGLALGYLNQPDLTAEHYVRNPCEDSGGRLYDTGDLARWTTEGAVEFLGREDQQVKLRGFRIEPGEIESALNSHPAIRESVVVVDRSNDDAAARLVGYLVASPPVPPLAEIRSYLRDLLPEHMVPPVLIVMDALPLTGNGKVDRRALPVPERTSDVERVEPRDPVERELAELWKSILKTDRIGVFDSFFESGGDSLLAANLAYEIQQRLAETVYVSAIFEAPTVAELAEYLRRFYGPAAERLVRDGASVPAGAPAELAPAARISSSEVEVLQRLIDPLPPRQALAGDVARNPRMAFILSPTRSGSTLFRTMLAGNPQLFAPPELDLMSFNTMRERRAKCVGRYAFVLEGAIVALVELLKCSEDEAKRIIADFEAQALSIKDLYGYILRLVGGRRLMVEKSTVYGHDPATLRRIEEDFEEPLYIHLVRHPCAVIRSFLEARTDRVLRFDAPFDLRQFGELEWTLQQRNILSFLQGIPAGRRLRVSFEELVRDPASTLAGVCRFLGVDEHPDMADPYRNESKRMTRGLRERSRVLGDYKFAQHGKLDPTVATRWKGEIDPASLGEPTLVLARELGYSDLPRAESLRSKPLSLQQQRLWFLDQAGVGVAYNVVSCARLEGVVDIERFERSLACVVERHHVLRTTFRLEDGEPRQFDEPRIAKVLRVEDVRGIPESAREDWVRSFVDEEAERPFDLERGPVFRATMIRIRDDEWIFALVVHHIVFDAHSMEVLFRELGEHYRSLTNGNAVGLAPLPLQYGEFAEAQRQLMTEEVLQRQLSYWRECLGGGVEPIELPLDRPRPAIQTYVGGSVPLSVDGALAARLKRQASAHDATQVMLLMTTWIALLARYSGQTDIAVGLGVVNRTGREIRELIGFFVNTVVLRGDLGGEPTFAELLARVRTSFVRALDNQDIPFERIVQELQPVRDPGRNPIFQVFFAANEFSAPSLELPGVRVSRFDRGRLAVHFDLELQIGEDGDGLSGCLLYNSDLFEPATIEQMRDHYLNLLEAVARDSAAVASALPMLDEAESRSLVLLSNDTAADYRRDLCVHQLVAEQATRTPESTAVRDAQGSWTYAELVRRSERLGSRLRSRGARPGVLVGLAVRRGRYMIEALLGILESGAAYVPLDVGHPPERLRHMLADSGAGLLVVDEASASVFGDFRGDLVMVQEGADETDVRVAAAPTAGPEDLAYVIYTSGSTGKPKGVEITHRNLVNFLESMRRAPGFTATDVLLAVTTLSFDIAGLELFLPLVSGGSVVIAPQDAVSDGETLQALLDQHAATVMQGTPATWQLLLHSGWEGKPGLKMLCGGEALPRPLAGALLRRGGELWNMYGPTETTVWSSTVRVEPEEESGAGPIPIGRPIANTYFYVLDRHARPVPRGVVGELWIGGDGVARGYLNRPELTAERFLADPFRNEPGARMYRTGDLVRYDSRGRLLFLGRIDHQVKLRGFRIELGEIESALMACPGVEQAAVTLHDDGAHDPRLIAYTVGDPGTTPDALSRHLAAILPPYMLPTRFVRLEAMPLSPSGKVDRRALPVPEHVRTAESAVIAPRTKTERTIAEIWEEVLRVANIGVHDDFFRLGGHSLIATQVLSRIAREFDLRMPLSRFFGMPTVAGMAEWVDQSLHGGRSAAAATTDGSVRIEGEI